MGGKGSGSRPAPFDPVEGVDPWDLQPGETDKAFAAFTLYRDMGPERAIRKVQEQLGQNARYQSVLEQWSSKWGWVTRAGMWDAHVDRRAREAILDAAEKKARDQLAVADGLWKTAAKSLIMWNAYLDFKMGQPNANQSEPPISPSDMQKLADTGLKLSQLLAGKPTEIQDQRMQITVDERRKGIQELIHNPKLRAAMKQVAKAMEGDAANPDAGGNGNAAVH